MRPSFIAASFLMAALAASPASAEQVGEVGVDWLGNDIVIEAVSDPEVEGVKSDQHEQPVQVYEI